MRGKQWDCISTLTGILFVIFVIFIIVRSSQFGWLIALFIVGILFYLLKKEGETPKTKNDYLPINKIKILGKENNTVTYQIKPRLSLSENQAIRHNLGCFLEFSKNTSRDDIVEKLGKPLEEIKGGSQNTLNYGNVIYLSYCKFQ
jgi:hypothetical protein